MDPREVALWVAVLVCASQVLAGPSHGRTFENGHVVCNKDNFITSDPDLLPLMHRHPVNVSKTGICGGEQTCCRAEMEPMLLQKVATQYDSLLHRHTKPLNYVLQSTAHSLQEHVAELIQHSENKTQTIFLQVYQSMSVLATEPVRKMYAGILRHATSRDPTAYDAEPAILDFFQEVFPLVYHHIVNPHLRDYSKSYKRCMREAWHEIRPFGDIPKDLANKVEQTMTAVRIFLQALRVGSNTLNRTSSVFSRNMHPRCREEMVRLTMCPWCRNLRARPCSGYCLNVMRGCLTHFSTALDLPWSGFIDGIDQLLQRQVAMGSSPASVQLLSSLEEVVRSLDVKTSEAIMKAMMEGTHLEERVKKVCGSPSWSDDDSQPSPPEVVPSTDMLQPSKVKVTQHAGGKRITEKLKEAEKAVAAQLDYFFETIRKSRSLYGSMAEAICSDDSFADTRDTADCWNGHRVGEYTKTVVAGGPSAQKYNPELPLTDEAVVEDMNEMSDHLRNARQTMMRLLTRQPESDSFMRDEEGSGDGPGVRYPSDDEENYGHEGSGSGEEPVGGFTDYPRTNVHPEVPQDKSTKSPTGGSSALHPVAISALLLLLSVHIAQHRWL